MELPSIRILALIIAVAIIIVIIAVYAMRREKLTRIYRGVGFYNTGNDPLNQVAAGVVNSGIMADYTHSYNDGGGIESCDLCPNAMVCPSCPQFIATDLGNPRSTQLVHDFSPEYMTSREKMGAASGTNGHNPPSGMFGERADIATGSPQERLAKLSGDKCSRYEPRVLNLLYKDIMGLDIDAGPAPDDCTYFGLQGYVYKDPCNMKSIINDQCRIQSERSSSNRN